MNNKVTTTRFWTEAQNNDLLEKLAAAIGEGSAVRESLHGECLDDLDWMVHNKYNGTVMVTYIGCAQEVEAVQKKAEQLGLACNCCSFNDGVSHAMAFMLQTLKHKVMQLYKLVDVEHVHEVDSKNVFVRAQLTEEQLATICEEANQKGLKAHVTDFKPFYNIAFVIAK